MAIRSPGVVCVLLHNGRLNINPQPLRCIHRPNNNISQLLLSTGHVLNVFVALAPQCAIAERFPKFGHFSVDIGDGRFDVFRLGLMGWMKAFIASVLVDCFGYYVNFHKIKTARYPLRLWFPVVVTVSVWTLVLPIVPVYRHLR